MDAVDGLYPWLFSTYTNANDFIFVLNGFLLTDINAISLNDIEEIVFSREQLYGSQIPFSRAGTFFIKTRTALSKFEININSQYNHAWNKEKYVTANGFRLSSNSNIPENNSDNKPGHYFSNHVSLAHHGKRASVYFSAQLNSHKFPEIHQFTIFQYGLPDTIVATTLVKNPDQRLFFNFTYKFSEKVDVGVTANYSHSNIVQDTIYSSYFMGSKADVKINSQSPLNYYHAGAFINYRPFKNLSNTFWFEYGYDTITTKYQSVTSFINSSGQPVEATENTLIKPESKRYLIRDQLSYNFARTKKFYGDLSMAFLYLRHDVQQDRTTIRRNNGNLSANGAWYLSKEKIASLNPTLNIVFQKMISAYVGANMLIGKKTYKYVEKKDKISFYGGLTTDFAQLVNQGTMFGDFSLSFHYADLPQNQSNDQWLGYEFDPYQSSPQSVFYSSLVSTSPFLISIQKHRLITVRLNATSHNHRFQFITEWSHHKIERNFAVPFFPSQYYLVPGTETQKGLSFQFSGKIIEKTRFKYKTSFSLLFPDTKLDLTGINPVETVDKSTLRAGWQNRIDYGDFFFQMNVLLDIDHAYYRSNVYPPKADKYNDICVNYLLLGYMPEIKNKSLFKDLTVFVQARNPFISKQLKQHYDFNYYGGAGVNVRF